MIGIVYIYFFIDILENKDNSFLNTGRRIFFTDGMHTMWYSV